MKARRSTLLRILDVTIGIVALVGAFLILRPLVNHWRQDKQSEKLLEDFISGDAKATISFDPNDLVVEGEAIESFSDLETAPTTDPDAPLPTSDGQPAKEKVVVTAIGRIEIPVIKVNMPIAEGATIYNLRVAIGRYGPSAQLGGDGRTVLFGHRMYTYGRHFNRLGEVKNGDTIIIENKEARYIYTVNRIDRVLPSDLLTKLYEPAASRELMLVTCDPVRVASHRLLVYAELTESEPK